MFTDVMTRCQKGAGRSGREFRGSQSGHELPVLAWAGVHTGSLHSSNLDDVWNFPLSQRKKRRKRSKSTFAIDWKTLNGNQSGSTRCKIKGQMSKYTFFAVTSVLRWESKEASWNRSVFPYVKRSKSWTIWSTRTWLDFHSTAIMRRLLRENVKRNSF